jgi:hypothetical protein
MIELMQIVEQKGDLKGPSKKQYVLSKIFKAFDLDEDLTEAFGNLIEILLKLDTNKIHIKKIKKFCNLICS